MVDQTRLGAYYITSQTRKLDKNSMSCPHVAMYHDGEALFNPVK